MTELLEKPWKCKQCDELTREKPAAHVCKKNKLPKKRLCLSANKDGFHLSEIVLDQGKVVTEKVLEYGQDFQFAADRMLDEAADRLSVANK